MAVSLDVKAYPTGMISVAKWTIFLKISTLVINYVGSAFNADILLFRPLPLTLPLSPSGRGRGEGAVSPCPRVSLSHVFYSELRTLYSELICLSFSASSGLR